MNNATQLAFGQLTPTDALVVQLLRPADMPAVERSLHPSAIRILWPTQPTVVAAREFPDVAAAIAKLFAGASVELSRLNAMKRGLL